MEQYQSGPSGLQTMEHRTPAEYCWFGQRSTVYQSPYLLTVIGEAIADIGLPNVSTRLYETKIFRLSIIKL